MKKKYIVDKNVYGTFNSWVIGNIEVDEFIKILVDLKNNHPNHVIRLELEDKENSESMFNTKATLVYSGSRLETDDEFETRKKQSERDRAAAKKKKEDRIKKKRDRTEKREIEQLERDKIKFQQLKEKHNW